MRAFYRALVLFAWIGAAFAAPPPRRPVELGKADATPETGAVAGPGATGRQPADVDVQSLKPYNLPPASRAKMRACGEQWRQMKLGGQAAGLTWRSFAEKCLPQ